ncbi:hypothetical protein BO79DRAFT_233929 [Aspergillus costaricaensis CBS 115574]|uniref:Uncharacterized protein n=1 Tax=Aspergillus costaricaensis CBS 115574 TaxID=1448317 RepID=A0ACD1IUY1_9EURO|nr:hypothetical protein BO79DRAFT_233929 [Aspergillus costaricaensis CBS 115574]RAK94094.1 hypothetical protein BO79DRAFT_233929 [Aspergillus costaricaensis CBS 115574]
MASVSSPLSEMSSLQSTRRRPIACLRCRRRKVRCDGASPACSNCARARIECFEGVAGSAVSKSRLRYLESRVRELESEALVRSPSSQNRSFAFPPVHSHEPTAELPSRDVAVHPPSEKRSYPDDGDKNSGHSIGLVASLPCNITRGQPLAHEVGLLSLANAGDPKYLGPSSGVTFARSIYQSAPASQDGALPHARDDVAALPHTAGASQPPPASTTSHTSTQNFSFDLPPMLECQKFAECYFSISSLYPFLAPERFYVLYTQLERVVNTAVWTGEMDLRIALGQVFLVLSIGARNLEIKLNGSFGSRELFAQAMSSIAEANLHGSVEGLQVLLLLAQHSFYNPEGLNAWHLVHTIIASCIDLGLHRRDNRARGTETPIQRNARYNRSAIFWSAYSIDRMMATILGRPLTLRDEAIDCDFPGLDVCSEVEEGATEWNSSYARPAEEESSAHEPPPPAPLLAPSPYIACVFSLRFDRLVAEIKLMLYRVSRSPTRFPWPTNLADWQQKAHFACTALRHEVQARTHHQQAHTYLSKHSMSIHTFPASRDFGSISTLDLQRLELKYHHCLMLLYRPSPQIRQPTPHGIQTCFASAISTIELYSSQHRFGDMECSWLTAHAIFVASITIIYCLWTHPGVVQLSGKSGPAATMAAGLGFVEYGHQLLLSLAQTWTMAHEACQKLAHLIKITHETQNKMRAAERDPRPPAGDTRDRTGPRRHSLATEGLEVNELYSQEDNNFGFCLDRQNCLIDELGILRDLFDIGWLDNLDNEGIAGAF